MIRVIMKWADIRRKNPDRFILIKDIHEERGTEGSFKGDARYTSMNFLFKKRAGLAGAKKNPRCMWLVENEMSILTVMFRFPYRFSLLLV